MVDSLFIDKVRDRLRDSEYRGPKFRENQSSMSGLVCSGCGSKEAWAYTKSPLAVICNRLNKCGAKVKTLDLFPELKQQVERDYKPTKEDPNKPATAFLQMRGLNKSLEGLKYRYQPNIRRTGSGGVMFEVAHGVENGRLFNPPQGEGKTHNSGSCGGLYWQHPGIEYDPNQRTIATEGIIDALSHVEMGNQAIALLSAGQKPEKFDLDEFPKLVFGFDRDAAGRRALKKWKEAFPEAGAIEPIIGDWNDFLQAGSLETAKERFEKSFDEFETRASLSLASTAQEYVEVYHGFFGRVPGLFDFQGCHYYSYAKAGTEKKPPELHSRKVSNFTVEVDHFQLDDTNQDEPINRFHLNISPRKGKTVSCSVTADELASSSKLTAVFMQRSRVLWEGDRNPSLALARKIVESGAPVVRQLTTTGYDSKTGCYVLLNFAIDRGGKLLLPNKRKIFDLSRSDKVRPVQQPSLKPEAGKPPAEIWKLVYQAWGEVGITAIAWVVACWWVNQIKEEIGFFPFLSIFGDPQTGKSRLVRLLNAIQGLDEEGLAMNRVNTSKGEIRKLAQRSGMFKALIEGNDREKIRFDVDSILPLYNYGNALQVQALKTTDTRTRDIPFLASLMFVQNTEAFSSRAQKERVISVGISKDSLTDVTRSAYDTLTKMALPELASFFTEIMKHRKQIEKQWPTAFERAKKDLQQSVPDNRINENHGILLAFHRLMSAIIGIDHNLLPYIEMIGQKKMAECEQRQETIADSFLKVLMEQDIDQRFADVPLILLRKDKGEIVVHVENCLAYLREKNHTSFNLKDLQPALQEHPSYVGTRRDRFDVTKNGSPSKVQCRAWCFDYRVIVREG
ncbi:MAG: toprim domain-containing protein [Magnetococcales bacterium]|nr:toprim domain-containing protein [Magnetococcales bacterium]